MSIADIFSGFIKNWSSKESLYLKIGTVSEINQDEFTFTFTPLDNTSAVLDVRMKTISDNVLESFIIVPKDGSKVVVGFHSNTVAQCLIVQESDKILINTEAIESVSDTKKDTIQTLYEIICNDVQITSDSFVFNAGTLDGLIKINDLTTKLNKLVTELNDFKDEYNLHQHLGVISGVQVSGITNKLIEDDMTDFDKDDYENPIIKH